MADVKKGDRVKVTIEGEVTDVQATGDVVLGGHSPSNAIFRQGGNGRYTATVEKIEPPVEVFRDGDLIRAKESPDMVIVLTGDGGYTYIGPTNKGLHVGHTGGHRATANSKHWEKIEL